MTMLAVVAPSLAQQSLRNSTIVENLATIVFGSEFVDEEATRVRKWARPLRIAVYGDDSGRYTPLVELHAHRLSEITGLDIAVVDPSEPDANGFVLFLGRDQFAQHARARLKPAKDPGLLTSLACFGLFAVDEMQEIVALRAVIPVPMPETEINACIVEEMTQMLGLPNDSFDVKPSIFNDDEADQALTWQDELFLRILYDERVTAGMDRTVFTGLARTILDELRPEP